MKVAQNCESCPEIMFPGGVHRRTDHDEHRRVATLVAPFQSRTKILEKERTDKSPLLVWQNDKRKIYTLYTLFIFVNQDILCNESGKIYYVSWLVSVDTIATVDEVFGEWCEKKSAGVWLGGALALSVIKTMAINDNNVHGSVTQVGCSPSQYQNKRLLPSMHWWNFQQNGAQGTTI